VERLARQKQQGLLSDNVSGAERPPKGKPWNELSSEQQQVEIRQMEIYAAMIDQIDQHTGRVIDYLKETGQFENTLIIFMSDNGGEGHDVDETWPADQFPKIRAVIDSTHDFSFENMGKPNSYVFQGPNWVWASQPALNLFKGAISEGGTRVAAFAYYPRLFEAGQIYTDMVSVKDIAPTLLELANVEHPGNEYLGRSVATPTGISQLSSWQQGSTQAIDRSLGMELMGKRAFRQGEWKITHMPSPYGKGDWQLFNLAADPSEKQDLSSEKPEVLAKMVAAWQSYAEKNGVILPDWVSGY
jgi:arylsulfatase